MCLVKGGGKAEKKVAWGPGKRVQYRRTANGPQDYSHAPAQKAAYLAWCQKVGSRGGASQGGVEPGDSDVLFRVLNIFIASCCYLL